MTPSQLLREATRAKEAGVRGTYLFIGVDKLLELAKALYDGSYTELNLWEIFKDVEVVKDVVIVNEEIIEQAKKKDEK